MGVVTYPTLEHIAQQARPYPEHVLTDCQTGLVLFAAAFLGHNDAIHFAYHGLSTTCVDVDGARLARMKELYPDDWRFFAGDAFKVAKFIRAEYDAYDAVSVDTFTGDMMFKALDHIPLWCSIALKAVTITCTSDAIGYAKIPHGWRNSYFLRATGVFWLVLERG